MPAAARVSIGLATALFQHAAAAIDWLIERPVVEVVSEYEVEAQDRLNAATESRSLERISTTRVDAKTDGWVYHPALVVFTSHLRPEFESRTGINRPGATEETDDRFLGYDLDTRWFQFKPISFGLGTTRERGRTTNRLAPDTTTQRTDYRGNLQIKLDPFPTSISATRTEKESKTLFTESTLSHQVTALATHRRGRSRAQAYATLTVEEREARQTREFERDIDTAIQQTLALSRESFLHSRVAFRHTSPKINSSTRNFEATSNGFFQLRPNLRSSANLAYTNRISSGFTSKKVSAGAGINHRLYENLTTNVFAQIDRDRQSNGRLDQSRARLDFAYSRRIPWGNLSATLGGSVEHEDDQRRGGFVNVTDESIVLTGTQRTSLANRDVDVATIVVTNTAGTVTFVEGVDYTVTAVGRESALTRAIAGAIASGDTVLVDYRYSIGGPTRTRFDTRHFSVTLSLFSSLSLSYRIQNNEEHLIAGARDALADDITRTFVVELDRGPSNTMVRYEKIDSVQSPTKQWTVREQLSYQPRGNLWINAIGELNNEETVDTGNVENTVNLEGATRWLIGRFALGHSAHLDLRAGARFITGDLQVTQDRHFLGILRWRFGAWEPSIELRLRRERDTRNRQRFNRDRLFMQIRRVFDFR